MVINDPRFDDAVKRLSWWPIHRLEQHADHMRTLGDVEARIADDIDAAAFVLRTLYGGRSGEPFSHWTNEDTEKRAAVLRAARANMKDAPNLPWLSRETLQEKD